VYSILSNNTSKKGTTNSWITNTFIDTRNFRFPPRRRW